MTQFDVTTIAVQRYKHHAELIGLVEEATAITRLLSELGGAADGSDTEFIDLTTATDLLRTWAARETASSVLIWLGHGDHDGTSGWLACFDTPAVIRRAGLNAQAMADQVVVDWERRQEIDDAWALVIVEACGAGIFVNNVGNLVSSHLPRRLCLIGVSGESAGWVGQLNQALAVVIGRLTPNDQKVILGELVGDLEVALADVAEVQTRNLGRIELNRVSRAPGGLCAPVDIYTELMTFLDPLPPDERNHFFPKVQAAEHGEIGFYFVGRDEERARIAEWLRDSDHGMFIVTGRPGCGKSAILGNVLIRSSPSWRRLLDRFGWSEPDLGLAAPHPPDDVFDAAVHLAGLDAGNLVWRLAQSLMVPVSAVDSGTSGGDVDALVEALARRRFTVLIDGLDEALDPIAIASTVLRRLADLPAGRVLVGTRMSTLDDVDDPEPAEANVLDALQGPATRVVRVPRDGVATAEYVRRRLAAARRTRGLDATDADIERAARLVADRDFLFARLGVHEILSRPALLREPKLDQLLSGTHRSLFAAAVQRLASSLPHAVPLLEALARARGHGVPRRTGAWATIATGLNDDIPVAETDIDALLEHAAPYIMLDAEYGLGVYRLAHRTFREVLVPEE